MQIFRAMRRCRISIKTRLGVREPAEFAQILALYRRYPLRELIVHPRTASQMYQGALHLDAYRACLMQLACPVCLNGEPAQPRAAARLGDGAGCPGRRYAGPRSAGKPRPRAAIPGRGGPAGDEGRVLCRPEPGIPGALSAMNAIR